MSEDTEEYLRSNKSEQDATLRSLQVTKSLQAFSGPLPHPDILRGYEDILPGCAEKILVMAVQEQKARHARVTKDSDRLLDHYDRGQHYALLSIIVTFLSAIYLAMNGHEAIATIIVSLDIVGIVAAFIFEKKIQLQNNVQIDPEE